MDFFGLPFILRTIKAYSPWSGGNGRIPECRGRKRVRSSKGQYRRCKVFSNVVSSMRWDIRNIVRFQRTERLRDLQTLDAYIRSSRSCRGTSPKGVRIIRVFIYFWNKLEQKQKRKGGLRFFSHKYINLVYLH